MRFHSPVISRTDRRFSPSVEPLESKVVLSSLSTLPSVAAPLPVDQQVPADVWQPTQTVRVNVRTALEQADGFRSVLHPNRPNQPLPVGPGHIIGQPTIQITRMETEPLLPHDDVANVGVSDDPEKVSIPVVEAEVTQEPQGAMEKKSLQVPERGRPFIEAVDTLLDNEEIIEQENADDGAVPAITLVLGGMVATDALVPAATSTKAETRKRTLWSKLKGFFGFEGK